MKVVCRRCGAGFDTKPAYVRAGAGKYCSVACKAAAGTKPAESRPCDGCGVPVVRKAYQFRPGPTFCSTGCRNRKVGRDSRAPARFDGDEVLIPLSQGKWSRVDRADYDSIASLREENWTATWAASSRTFYALRSIAGEAVMMHRLIMGNPDGVDVDHEDHDGLNNTRRNLRACTRGQNLQNRRKARAMRGVKTSSRYKGVHRNGERWIAQFGGKHLGSFQSEREAAEAYNAAASGAYGGFAFLNELIPEDDDPRST